MNKIILDINVPALGVHFDILVTPQIKVRDVCVLLGKAVEEYSDGAYVSSSDEVLCSASRGVILRAERYISEYQLKNGDSLLFC